MKRLLLILIIFVVNSVLPAAAAENYLNSVVLEGVDNSYNVILRSDAPARVKKSLKSDDSMILTLKGVTAADNVNTVYKNTSNVNNIVVANSSNGELKIYINAKNIAGANVLFNTPNSAPIPVGDKFAREKMIWAMCLICFSALMIHNLKAKNRRIVKKINMRDREIEFYKAGMPSINYQVQRNYVSLPFENNPKTIREYQDLKKIRA